MKKLLVGGSKKYKGLMQLLRKYLQTTIKEDVSNLFALSLSRAKGGGEEEG